MNKILAAIDINMTGIIVGLLGLLSGIVIFVLNKPKQDAEANKIRTDERGELLKQLDAALDEAKTLREENRILSVKLEESSRKIEKLIRQITVLKTFTTIKK